MPDKVSVITVTLNAAATLERTIESVINQSYNSIEYLIIDGDSSDGTKEIIKKYQSKISYYLSEKDNGIYDAMNKALKVSKGDWVIFLGADDFFYSTNILDNIFNSNNLVNYDFIYGDVKFKSNGKVYGKERNYDQLIGHNITHQSIFYKKNMLDKLHGFNAKYKILADYDLNLRIFRNTFFKKKYIAEIITLFNDKGLSNTTIDELFFKDQLNYLINVENKSKSDPSLQQYYFYYGFARILKNKRSEGFKNIFHSLISGKRKFYFFLVAIKFLLSQAGIGKKIKVTNY